MVNSPSTNTESGESDKGGNSITKELHAIIEAFAKIKEDGKTAALATVVKVKGSTYRQPGARMLITPNGQMVGAISGGCLENDVFERAQKVMVSGESALVTYDTTSNEDIVWGLGLGCNGVVQVLIEPLDHRAEPNYISFLAECLSRCDTGVVATVFHTEGEIASKIGSRMMLGQDGKAISDIKDIDLDRIVIKDACEALCDGRSKVKEYQLLSGKAEVLIEAIQPPVMLVILGAGNDAIPVVCFAKELGWHVTVVDSRPAYATLERFPLADVIALSRPETAYEYVHLNARTAVVVMTHNYLHDLTLLKTLMPFPLRYLGILGPKSRTKRLLQKLMDEGVSIAEKNLNHLYSPIGLDIGTDTPEEIALSIVAEIKAVLADRSGGSLRERKGPIHSRMYEDR